MDQNAVGNAKPTAADSLLGGPIPSKEVAEALETRTRMNEGTNSVQAEAATAS